MTKHTVYFLSSQQHRSLMAEMWANRLKLPDWDIKSAAWKQPVITETTIEILKEVLADLPDAEPRLYDPTEAGSADLIIAMHDGSAEQSEIPGDLPAQKLIHWDIPSPDLRSADSEDQWAIYQEVCDEIAMQVKGLEPLLSNH